ncbi:MAG: hypothetical protein CMD65_04395 [Gammaproteobacteria bacterium]|nr:hypothetical protein [Gammaproteobacteria bacterium]
MRIIIILIIIILVYFIIKSLTRKNTKLNRKSKNNMAYCKYCDTYMPQSEFIKHKCKDMEK